MGRRAGPESPPTTLDKRGLRVSTSMAMAGMVLMREMASAPADSTLAAMAAMSETLGLSLGMTGSRVHRRLLPPAPQA